MLTKIFEKYRRARVIENSTNRYIFIPFSYTIDYGNAISQRRNWGVRNFNPKDYYQ